MQMCCVVLGVCLMEDEPSIPFDLEIREGDTLWTDSLLRLWWLTTFRGYRVITVRQAPRESAFGRVRYARRWLLGSKPLP